MVLCAAVDGKNPVDLLAQHYSCKLVRERHLGHRKSEICSVLDLIGQPVAAAYDKRHATDTLNAVL